MRTIVSAVAVVALLGSVPAFAPLSGAACQRPTQIRLRPIVRRPCDADPSSGTRLGARAR